MQNLMTLRVFLDNLEEGVLFLDGERRVLQMNLAARRMLGQADESFIGSLCPSHFAGTTCARECEIRGNCSLMPTQEDGRKSQDVTLKLPDDEEISLRMWAMRLPPNESAMSYAIILRDCSREMALEKQIRERWQLGGLTGRSRTMQDLYQKVLRAAASEANVLITGESGVGKELVARALHDNSSRAKGEYVAVHCASLQETLLESELFGHAKGAFSGAIAARPGRFEAANGGTLLLDEIGEISPATQTKLLRVLQEREIVRVGENRPRKVDVRVIAATHRDLAAMVKRGEFREDLFYRLRVLPLDVPPLRERREDIPLLISKLLSNLAERYRRPDLTLSPEATIALEAYDWPGNVRHLFNALEYAVVHAAGTTIRPKDLPSEVVAGAPPQAAPFATAGGLTHYYRTTGDDTAEWMLIQKVLEESGGNKAEAARRLGMSRTTLWKRLNQAG
ncbi:sigma-54 interaction domain-containing protein [Noviherbaspirillum autotrophicum]|uniref:Fis family transcriptional regulator n=1 Tax=Noviherbaspirillum autotrophicum TaxID=709839 RepID=A0A0C1YJD7_9BURK|nr:sigma 54-interacting transcriptional regulator [Noviherbaspirillum autotrophicum]KIF80622.1 Fis family transcriptional regulator [Noviherbaspirillum autotrophicum]